MTIQELLENAQLDALGLLDEQERDAFEAAFASAPPALQDQIRREQARWCRPDELLPNVKPRAELKARVMAAVAEAAGTPVAADLEPVTYPMASRRVSAIWRAAAIGMGTAAVVFGVAFVQIKAENQRIDVASRESAMKAALLNAGGRYTLDMLFKGDARPLEFVPVKADRPGRVALWTSSEWDSSRLIAWNLPALEGQTLRLVVLDAAGNVTQEVKEFTAKPGDWTLDEVKFRPDLGMKLAIYSAPVGQAAGQGTLLFRTA